MSTCITASFLHTCSYNFFFYFSPPFDSVKTHPYSLFSFVYLDQCLFFFFFAVVDGVGGGVVVLLSSLSSLSSLSLGMFPKWLTELWCITLKEKKSSIITPLAHVSRIKFVNQRAREVKSWF